MRTDRQGPIVLNLSDGVMPGRPAGCAAHLGKTAGLPCAAQHTLRAFWTSCRLRRMDQSILEGGNMSQCHDVEPATP
jgi:hypothetical protein